ncbi:MAG: HAMP domain-containing sensor histidine kinase [Steroidobacteraceae bacterium]
MDEPKHDSARSEAILNRLMELARVSALAEMASGIAHELNQPLGAIATFSQAGDRLLNRAEPMVPRAREVFQQINTEALNAGEGIRRIRRLFDHTEPVRVPSQMSAVVAELVPALDALARAARISLKFEVQSPLPDVSIDRLRIQLVLFSLVQNALDASNENSGEQVVVQVAADRYSVETSIIDSGAGIPAEVADKLFHPFFTTKSGGTGLGLASSRASIEAHEGTIGFAKASPTGSRFWFRLPIVPS